MPRSVRRSLGADVGLDRQREQVVRSFGKYELPLELPVERRDPLRQASGESTRGGIQRTAPRSSGQLHGVAAETHARCGQAEARPTERHGHAFLAEFGAVEVVAGQEPSRVAPRRRHVMADRLDDAREIEPTVVGRRGKTALLVRRGSERQAQARSSCGEEERRAE